MSAACSSSATIARGASDLGRCGAIRELPGDEDRFDRLRVGVTGEPGVERLEGARRIEQDSVSTEPTASGGGEPLIWCAASATAAMTSPTSAAPSSTNTARTEGPATGASPSATAAEGKTVPTDDVLGDVDDVTARDQRQDELLVLAEAPSTPNPVRQVRLCEDILDGDGELSELEQTGRRGE